MDAFINAKIEKQTIYEIYRACRLCGAGAGYKMPIIQNVVNLNGAEVDLKQKIRECVQIEVHQDDKMPPLICELCVDKVNDFYEFFEMCRHTNKRTRLRLGLPPQTMPRGAPDAGDCILGVTEPVFINEDSTDHTMRSRNKSSKSGKNKRVNVSNNSKRETRDSRDSRNESRTLRSKQPSPPRLRGTKRGSEADNHFSNIQKSKKIEQPRSILKKPIKIEEEDSYLTPRTKRSRDREVLVKREDNKRVKLLIKPLPPRSSKSSSVRGKSPPLHQCQTCKVQFDNYRSLSNHMRIHQYVKQANRKPIKKESKDVQCTDCKKSFPRKTLLNIHKCPKQGGDCSVCKKHFYSQSSLIRHRSTCVQKKKEVVISPKIRRILKPLHVRVSRCDPLLENLSGEHYDVSDVAHDYGLDKTLTYPYISRFRFKSEPGYMVNINDDIRQAFDADKYVHWDSEDTDSDAELEISKCVDSLTSLSLKTLFSHRMIGKVPKRRRKVKAEKAFDSILNVSEFDSELNRGINDIIDSLDDTVDESVNKVDESFNKSVNKSGDNDSLFGDENAATVTNDDFDSLFDKSNNNDKVGSELKSDEMTPESNSGENVNENSKTNDLDLGKQDNSEVEKDISNEDSIENIENSELVNSKNDSTDINNDISSNEEEKSKQESETNSSSAIEVNEEEKSQIYTENEVAQSENSETVNDTVVNEANDTANNDKESTNEKNDDIVDDKGKTEYVNGNRDETFNIDGLEDMSEGDMDDKRLMEALDAEIGENQSDKVQETEREAERTTEKTKPALIKSADLESISDDDFNLND